MWSCTLYSITDMKNNRIYGKNNIGADLGKPRQLCKWNTNKNNYPPKINFDWCW